MWQYCWPETTQNSWPQSAAPGGGDGDETAPGGKSGGEGEGSGNGGEGGEGGGSGEGGGGGAGQVETVPLTPVGVVGQEQTVAP